MNISQQEAQESLATIQEAKTRTRKAIAATEGRFTLDGARDKTIYYEVVIK